MSREDVKSSIRISPPLSRTSPTSVSSPSNGSPPIALSISHIEAVIQMATASAPEGPVPGRDTRTQLFVGNLPYRVRWQDLKDLFRKAGTVLRADVSLGPDNRSRGYGTVLFATREDAARAVEMFNGYNWQTRILEVRLDRLPPADLDMSNPSYIPSSMGSSSATPFLGYGYPSSLDRNHSFPSGSDDFQLQPAESRSRTLSNVMTRNLFVGNLPFHCQWQDLKDLFRQAGTIIRADVALGPDGRSRGFGTVSFANDIDAERAVSIFNGYDYNGRILKVHYDKFVQSQTLQSQAQSPLLRLTSPNPLQPSQSPFLPLPSRPDSSTAAVNAGSHIFMPMSAPLPSLERALTLPRQESASPFHRPITAASLYHDVYPTTLNTLNDSVVGIQSGAPNAPPASATTLSPTAHAHPLSASLNHTPQFTSSQKSNGELGPSVDSKQISGSLTHSHRPSSSSVSLSSSSPLSLPPLENGLSSALPARKPGPPPVPLSTKPSLSSVSTKAATTLGPMNEDTLIPSLNTSVSLSSPLTALRSTTSTSPKTSTSPTTLMNTTQASTTSDPAPVSTTASASVQTLREEPTQAVKTLSRSRQNSSHHHAHPGPITLPSSSLPFPSASGRVPMSPFQGLPPITPSMPTFTFVPQNATPPLNPHFLSPGVGLTPFSPPAPMSPGSYYHPDPRYHPMPWNPAPGAPIHHHHHHHPHPPHSPIYALHGHSPLHSPSAAPYFATQPSVVSGPTGPPTDYFSVPPLSMATDGYFPPVYPAAENEANNNHAGAGLNTDSTMSDKRPDERSSSDDSVPTNSDNSFFRDGESQGTSRNSSDSSSWHNSPDKLHSIAEELGRISIGVRALSNPSAGDDKTERGVEQAPSLPSGPQRTHSDEAKLPTMSSLENNPQTDMSNNAFVLGTGIRVSSLPLHSPGERRASWTPEATKSVFRRELMSSIAGSPS